MTISLLARRARLLAVRLRLRLAHDFRGSRPFDERGDVAGWVMITVMTVGVVALIAAWLGPELNQLLHQAIRSVGG